LLHLVGLTRRYY